VDREVKKMKKKIEVGDVVEYYRESDDRYYRGVVRSLKDGLVWSDWGRWDLLGSADGKLTCAVLYSLNIIEKGMPRQDSLRTVNVEVVYPVYFDIEVDESKDILDLREEIYDKADRMFDSSTVHPIITNCNEMRDLEE